VIGELDEAGPPTFDPAMNRDGVRNVVIDNNPTTYAYVVPTAVYDDAQVSVGNRVLLRTDGQRVLKVVRDTR
jgi:hypothetical protein